MSKLQTLERTITEYEEELRHFKEENQEQQLQDINRSIVPPSVPSPGPSLSQDITEGTRIKEEQQEEEPLTKYDHETGITVIVKTEESLLLQGQTELKEEPQEKEVSSQPHLRSDTEEQTEDSSDSDSEEQTEDSSSSDSEEQTEDSSSSDSEEQSEDSSSSDSEEQTEDSSSSDTEEQTEDSSSSDSDDWKRPLRCSDPLLETEPDGGYYSQVQIRGKTTASQRPGLSSEHKSAPETSATVKIRDETGTKGDECPLCKNGSVTKQGLQVHVRNHTGEKRFKCSICEKLFRRKSTLEAHKLIHTGEKPFKCSVCNKSFNQKGNLKQHRLIHTKEKPFSCPLCEKTFNYSSSLKRHKRTHTSEKPLSVQSVIIYFPISMFWKPIN